MSQTPCPSPRRLRQFAIGELTDDEVRDRLEHHLDVCTTCVETLGTVDIRDDQLIQAIRGNAQVGEYASERDCLEAISRAEALVFSATLHESSRQRDFQTPHSIGSYDLFEPLGSGGMGAVYRAVHKNLKREVAIKLLTRSNEAAGNRFERELRAIGALEHPNIVQATDGGMENGQRYLVMELIRGVDLSRLSTDLGKIPIADACELIRQAAQGLAYVHERGILHRDVKPSNLMLSHGHGASPQVKVLDLGLALMAECEDSVDEMTRSGQMMGTLEFMAPEQLDDSHAIDQRADIYSLGMTFYKLLSGKSPYESEPSPGRKLRAIMATGVPSIATQRRDLPVALVLLVDSMLASRPADRPQSMAAVAEELAAFTNGHDLARLSQEQAATIGEQANDTSREIETLEVEPSTSRASNHTFVLGMVFGGLALLAAIVFFLQTNDGTLRVEINDPDVKVRLEEHGIVLTQADSDREINVAPGVQSLTVTRGEFSFTTDKLILKNGEEIAVRVEWLADRVEIRRGEIVIAQSDVPAEANRGESTPADAVAVGQTLREPVGTAWPAKPDEQWFASISNENDRKFLTWLKQEVPDASFVVITRREDILSDQTPLALTYEEVQRFPAARNAILLDDDSFIEGVIIPATDANAAMLSRLPLLRTIWFRNTPNRDHLSDNAIKLARSLPRLEILDFDTPDRAFNDESVRELKRFPRLRVLMVKETAVTGPGIVELAELATTHLSRLEELSIGGTHKPTYNDTTLRSLGKIKSLRELTISAHEFSDDGFTALLDLELEFLYLYRCPFTNKSLETILNMKSLRYLIIKDSEITPDGLQVLRDHPTLEKLQVRHVPYDDKEVVAKLREALPNLKLITDFGEFKATE